MNGLRPILTTCIVAIAFVSCSPPQPKPLARVPKAYGVSRAVKPVFREMRRGLKPITMVLTYHDVIAARGAGSLWFDCTTAELQRQIDTLVARHASFITLDQLYEHLTKGSKLPPNPVAVTFADNYLGFYDRAMPIFRRRHIPVAMFVHTGYVGSKVGRPKMSWSHLQRLDREGLVTIGSQTVSHPADLRTLGDDQVMKEMAVSKADLERHLEHPVRYLAYPNGKFDGRSSDAARNAGYLMAFSEEQTPAEGSPSILEVARYVHTKMRKAWADTHTSNR